MSFRTLIEVWLPPATAPAVSDFLIWFVPVVFCILAFFYLRDFVKSHLTVIGGTALVFFAAHCWAEIRTENRDIGGGKLYLGDANHHDSVTLIDISRPYQIAYRFVMSSVVQVTRGNNRALPRLPSA